MTEASVFAAALEKPNADRAAYLAEVCAGDEKLRRRVEALLRAHAAPDDVLDPATANYAPIAERPGTVIGKYKLMEQIGEGGMGLVFVAEQLEPVRRKVALKIIKPGMDTREVIARFEAERQALAMMDHPNIARVLDAGATESGRPYFVMELVRGVPITNYCDQNQLTPRERLPLFTAVCQAVQHAHHKGIIHRDLKPSNILVTLHDATPVVKVIDFGVAKAVGQHLTDKTIYTRFMQMVGTPLYMSPEQAEMCGLDIDTRSDIYSLGVLLYELLTGVTPFDRSRLQSAAFDEIRRIIREEEPPKPSTRLTQSPESLPTVAAQRRTEPRKLSALVRGELDWIVMRCLEKDRTRRYESATALARDVERFVHDEPVEARPTSAAYKLRKFARRNRAAVLTAALAAVLVVAGLAGTGLGLVAAIQSGSRARYEAARARQAEHQAALRLIDVERERDAVGAERNEKVQALQRAHGMHALLRSELVRAENPGLALILAVDGAKRNPGLLANNTLLAAMDACHEVRTLIGHEGGVQCCGFSPDGTRAVTGGRDGTARVWQVDSGKELLVLRPHDKGVVRAVFSPNGNRIVTISAEMMDLGRGTESGRVEPVVVRLWDAATGALVARWDDEPRDGAAPQRFRSVVYAVRFSPDGRKVVTTAGTYPGGSPQIHDTETGDLLLRLDGHKDPVVDAAFNHDGTRLVTASLDTTAVVWDAATGKPLHTLKHSFGVGAASFSPDGTRILTMGNGATAWRNPGVDVPSGTSDQREEVAGRVWDAATGKEVATFRWPRWKARGYSAVFSPDGRRVVTASDHYLDQWGPHGFPWVWDAATGKPLVQEIGRTTGTTSRFAAFSPDPGGRTLLTITERAAYLWDAATGHAHRAFRGHGDSITAAAFGPGGRLVLTASADGTARIWNADVTPDGIARRGRWPIARGGAVSPDGQYLVAFPGPGIWDLQSQTRIHAFEGYGLTVFAAAFTRDSRRALTVALDHAVRIWDPRTGRVAATLTGHSQRIRSAEFSPDGQRVVTASEDGTARVWSAETGKELFRLQQNEQTRTSGRRNDIDQFIGSATFSPDGAAIVATPASSANWCAGLWDARTGKFQRVMSFRDGWVARNPCAVFSPDGRRVATATPPAIWDVETGKQAVVLEPRPNCEHIAFSPDGRWVVASSQPEPVATVHDAATGKRVATLTGHTHPVDSASFGPNSDRVATTSEDGTTRVWDVPSGRELLTLPTVREVELAVFLSDNRRLFTFGHETRLWPLDPLAVAKPLAPRDLTAAERARFQIESER